MSDSNLLAGLPLDYLIGADAPPLGLPNRITETGYDCMEPRKAGLSIAYCNLFNEKFAKQGWLKRRWYGPYLKTSDAARSYGEGQIDPDGRGWLRNLREQFSARKQQGFEFIELDNPDAYDWVPVRNAVGLAGQYGLKVIAKNPLACNFPAAPYVAHPNIYGIIVERDTVTAREYHNLRVLAGKPDLPVWFVSFGSGYKWAMETARDIQIIKYLNMGVTYSAAGEYKSSNVVLLPKTAVV